MDADIPKSEVTQQSPTNANNQINQDSADAFITPIVTEKSSTVNSKYTYNMFENPGPLAEINQGAASTFRSGI